MARGQITPYDPGSFSPSAVGVPGSDQSGQILAQGISAVGKALAEREDTSNTLEAMDNFGSFQLSYQQKKLDLQKQYQDDPTKYPEAVRQMGTALADQMGRKLSSGGVKKFRYMTSSLFAQDADNNALWSVKRGQEIDLAHGTSAYQNLALSASTVASSDDLMKIQTEFGVIGKEVGKLVTPETNTKLAETYWDLAKKQAMSAQVFARPMQLIRDLEGGAYDNLLTADEKLTWKDKARNAVTNKAIDDQFRTMFLAQGKLLDFQNGLENGSITITDLVNEREAAFANRNKVDATGKRVVSPDYIKGLDNLIDIVTAAHLKVPGAREERNAVLKKFDTDWDNYLAIRKEPSQDDVEKELKMYADLSSLYRDGTITKEDFDQKVDLMRTKLALRQKSKAKVSSFNAVIDEAGTVPMFGQNWWRKSGTDVVSVGYQMIKESVDQSYPELTMEDRRGIKAQMLSQYTKQIQAQPEEIISGLKNENEIRQFATRLIRGGVNKEGQKVGGVISGNTSYTDPETSKVYVLGDEKVQNGYRYTFKGKDQETGAPIWKLTPGQIVTNSAGAKGLVQDDGTIKRL